MSDSDVNRRSFLQSAVRAGVSLAASQTTCAAVPAKMIGIQEYDLKFHGFDALRKLRAR
jgi:hypothetical protein